MPKLTNLHLTNMPVIDGFAHAPCVDPRHLDTHKLESERIVVIDYEHDEQNIDKGDREAIARARAVMTSFVKATSRFCKLGWYWWPPCYRKWGVATAGNYESLCGLADFLAPSFYACTDDPSDIMLGAKHWLAAVSKYSPKIRRLPRIGFVCPVQAFSGRACSDTEIELQVRACVYADCEAMYVWTGEPGLVRALLTDSMVPQVMHQRQLALALLAGRGYRIPSPMNAEALHAEEARITKVYLQRFAAAWEAAR